MKFNIYSIKFKEFFPSFIFTLCVLEMMLANFMPLFPVRFFQIYLLYFIFVRLGKLKVLRINDNGLVLYFFFIILYLIAFIRSENYYDTVLGEIANFTFWTIFAFILSFENKSDTQFFNKFIYTTSILLFLSSFVIYYLSFKKGMDIYNNNILEQYLLKDGSIMDGTSLNSDYNIYSLALCITILFGSHLVVLYKNVFLKLLFWMSVPFVGLLIFFSGSRRGFVFFFITAFILIFYQNNLKGKRYTVKSIISYSIVGVVSFLVFTNFEFLAIYLESFAGNMFSALRVLTLKTVVVTENERTIRWDYFLQLFSDFSFSEVFFGKNFDYIEQYGKKFYEVEDNPHNFIISTILYGGFLSLVTLIILIVLVLRNLLRAKNYLFFIMFILFILFGFTSSNTLFSSKIPPLIITFALLNYKTEFSIRKKKLEGNTDFKISS